MFGAGKSGGVTTPTDPQFNYVTMLLHGDGTNGGQNNTFLDSSTNNFTITRNGNTTQGSFSPYGSLWSNVFPTTNTGTDNLTVSHNSALSFTASNDFTVESWIYLTAQNTYSYICSKGNASTREWGFTARASTLEFYWSTDGTSSGDSNVSASFSFQLGTWYHVAACKSGSSVRLFVNGVQQGSTGTFTTIYNGTSPFRVATFMDFTGISHCFAGNISNLRVVKGTALYTSNFTPSTSPLTAVSGTSLLTCQSNRFVDNSANNFTITVNGSPRVTNFAPFNPTAAYSTATNGGSGYFDGSGDYLSVADNAALDGFGDFTIEFWAYFNTFTNNDAVLTKGWVNGGYGAYLVLCDGATLTFYASSNLSSWDVANGINIVSSVVTGQWYHIAITRSGSTLRTFANGSLVSTATNSTAINSSGTAALTIGAANNGSGDTHAFISDARIVKGTAVYTSAFTPPTAPLTAITNTSLLLNFTNAAIFDNSMKNDLETVGNAQISTSVKKYGTGSIYFDGTGDYLQFPTTNVNKFGGGDFTIEGWIYRNNSNDGGFYSDRASSPDFSGLVIYIKSDRVAVLASVNGTSWGLNTVATTEGNSVPVTTWSHLAITRSSDTWRVFIDGVLSYSKTLSGTLVQSASAANIGVDIPDSKYLNGYIDDLRITKGYARYTANFTPPTQAFPNQ